MGSLFEGFSLCLSVQSCKIGILNMLLQTGIVAFGIRGGFLVLGLLGCGKSSFGESRYGGSEFGV